MDPREVLHAILTLAVHAPSGDNAQPWEFAIRDHSVTIFNVPQKDATLYNYKERGSILAHGALVENINIIAPEHRFATFIEPFPGATEHVTARITFTEATTPTDPLQAFIKKRVTNRKPYAKKSLTLGHRAELEKAAGGFPGVGARLIEGEDVNALATSVSVNERLLFENRELHDFLFDMIRWTRKEEKERSGLFVKTMEFPAPLRFLLKHVFSRFLIVRMLNLVGLSKTIPKSSAANYAASSAIGAIVIPDESDLSYFNGGRALQRLWLTATKLGLSLQPVTAIPYLAARVKAGEADMFSDAHRALILQANDFLSKEFALQGDEKIAMLFRIGYCDEPTARSFIPPPVIRDAP